MRPLYTKLWLFIYIFITSFVCILLLLNSFKSRLSTWFNDEDRNNQRLLQKKICNKQAVQDTGAFCIGKKSILDGWSYVLDVKVCKSIEDLIGHSTVADFGAGLGQYGRCLLRKVPKVDDKYDQLFKTYYNGIINALKEIGLHEKPPIIKSWEGFDGGINAEDVSEKLVKYLDLAKPFDLGKTYDWVISLEVGEHIPSKYEDIFINNIAKHANKGVILSWAIPGQEGKSHVNTRANQYIIDKFTKKGLIHDMKSQDFIRKNTTIRYFATNIMVFKKVV